MPAILDDPTAPAIPAPTPTTTPTPLAITLRDGTPATVYPILTPASIPASLVAFLAAEFNAEIERGDTYPHETPLSTAAFHAYWFGTFGAVLLAGAPRADLASEPDRDWARECLGTFYIKPNYPGRCAHVCNGGFLAVAGARGRGCGAAMGQAYVAWARMLGYRSSLFNLVFETNVASLRVWERLGFEKVGRVKGAARLRSWPGRWVDAWVVGREL